MRCWCFTGPYENWEYGVINAVWATNNEHNHKKWFHEMQPSDDVLVYVTGGIGIIGYCKISDTTAKREPWWNNEIARGENLYPNVIYLSNFFLVADILDKPNLIRFALKSTEWKQSGLTQRNITGGVNAIKNRQVFDNLISALNKKASGNITNLYASNKELPGPDKIRESITKYSAGGQFDLKGAEPLDFNDIDGTAIPEKIDTIIQIWRRNRLIVSDQKRRVKNRCEIPGCQYQPFNKDSGEQYSEAHHIIPLGRAGSESPKNLAILCPNHHREIHYGVNRHELTRKLAIMKNLSSHLNNIKL
jgi:hypothetical protein